MKRFFKTLMILLSLAVLFGAVGSVAYAQKTVTAEKYIYIGSPKSISCSDKIYIVGDQTLYVFSYDYELIRSYPISGIKDATGNAILTLFSTDDGIYLLTGEGATKRVAPASSAYCLVDSTLYYAEGSTVTVRDLSTEISHSYEAKGEVCSMAAANGKVYYSVKSDVEGYSDVYSISNGQSALEYDYCRSLIKLLGGDKLYYYSAGYAVNPTTGERVMLGGDLVDVSLSDGKFYYVTYGGELYQNVNGANTLIFACTGYDKGYFSFPKSTYSDFGRLFVMDYANNRVAVMDEDVTYLPVQRPTCATSDYSGNLFVAGKDEITVFDSYLNKTGDITCPYGKVTSITYSDGLLYVCADGQVYHYDGKSFSQSLGQSKAIKAEYYGGTVYSLTDNGIVVLKNGNMVVEKSDVIDFDVDYLGNIYVLTTGEITTYTDGVPVIAVAVDEGVSAIALSNVTNRYTDYGNLLLTTSRSHSVSNLICAQPQEIPVPDLSFTEHSSIIRTTLGDCFIYENPCSIKKVCAVKKGASVIVGKFDLYESERMSYVLYEDEYGLKSGYMYKGLLSAPLTETAPSAAGGNTVYENTSLYRFPSAGSEKLIAGIGKNVYVTLLPFAEYEYNGMGWYKVRYNNKYGFIAKDMISVTEYVSDDQRPQYNASLKSFAGLYQPTGNDYVETGKALSAGTEVEIVGSFDQNRKYTRIKYFDKVLGVQEAYVLTSALDVYNVTSLQIIGLIGAGVVILLIAVLVIIKLAHKRRLL